MLTRTTTMITRFTFCLLLGMVGSPSLVGGAFVHVGCFELSYALSMNYHKHVPGVSLGDCVALCSSMGVKNAGIERSDNFCYCGDDIAEESQKRPSDMCNVDCSDYTNQKCGGDWLMTVYDISGQTRVTTTTPPSAINHEVSDDVVLAVGHIEGVTFYNTSSVNVAQKVVSTADWAYSVDYHWSKKLLFLYSRKKIMKSTLLSPFRLVPTTVKNVTICDGFAVDWVQDRIYWADCSITKTTVKSMDLDGNNVTSVMVQPKENIRRMEIDPYKGVLFWLADGVVESCSLAGQEFRTNMSEAGVVVRAMTLDLKAQRVYYVGMLNYSSSLYSMDYQGSSQQEHFSLPNLRSVYGMGLMRGTLYWVNYADSRDIIYKAPLNLTTTMGVKVVKLLDKAVWHMKVVHPELQQSPTSLNPCHNKVCSHSCVVKNNVPQCECPGALQLDSLGVACLETKMEVHDPVLEPSSTVSRISSKVSSSSVISLTVLLVCSAVLITLVLLYLGQRYWPSLQARMSSVPYKRESSGMGNSNPQFNTTDDNVNLI